MNIKKIGIKKFTDLPIPFITPNPTIKHVKIIKIECQKINFPEMKKNLENNLMNNLRDFLSLKEKY